MVKQPISFIDEEVGANLIKISQEKGLTAANLARLLDCSVKQIEAYESGTKRITAKRLRKLAEHMDVSVSSFFSNYLAHEDQFLGEILHAYIYEDLPLPKDATATEVLAHLRSYLGLSAEKRRYINKTTTLLKVGF